VAPDSEAAGFLAAYYEVTGFLRHFFADVFKSHRGFPYRDAEFCRYPDEGCELVPSCLNCLSLLFPCLAWLEDVSRHHRHVFSHQGPDWSGLKIKTADWQFVTR